MKKYHKSDLQKELKAFFKNEYYTKVYAEIYGTPMYLNEHEVRFLQVKCKIAAENGTFEDFIKNHIVYNGPRKRGGEPMTFREDGMFSTEFRKGFYNINAELAYELF